MQNTLAAVRDPTYEIAEVIIDSANRRLIVHWADGHESRYPWAWLRHAGGPAEQSLDRDGAFCPANPTDLRIQGVEMDGPELRVEWDNDALVTRYRLAWLRDRCQTPDVRAARKHRPILWDGEQAHTLPWIGYADLRDEASVFRLLVTVRDYGFARVLNVPTLSGVVDQVARYFGTVQKPRRDRTAKVSGGRPAVRESGLEGVSAPQTDECFRHFPAGVILMHCLKSDGEDTAETVLIDGFLAADRLRLEESRAFELLSAMPLPFVDPKPSPEPLRTSARILSRDVDGDVVGIRYCARALAPFDLPESLVEPTYRAWHAFARQLEAPDLTLSFRMRPGDLYILDNHRVLHGRVGGTGTETIQARRCTVSRDDHYARYRALAARFAPEDADLELPAGALG